MKAIRHPRHPVARLAGVVTRLPRYLKLALGLARDSRVPGGAKVALAAGIGYVAMPVDLVPGIIPVAGQLDDLAALLLALRQAVRASPAEVAREHLDRTGLSEGALDADLRTLAVVAVWVASRTFAFGARVVGLSVRGLLSARRLVSVARP